MDSSTTSWLSEMGLDNPSFTDQFDVIEPFEEELAAVFEQDWGSCLPPQKNSSTLINIASGNLVTSFFNYPGTRPPRVSSEAPAELQKYNSSSNFSTVQGRSHPLRASSTPIILNFENAKSSENPGTVCPGALNTDEEARVCEILRSRGLISDPREQSKRLEDMKKSSHARPASQKHDRIVEERKRRESLGQHFAALAAIVPGLKKMDKSSVLGGAIEYLRRLQGRVKTLEEQATKKTMESAMLAQRSQVMLEDDDKERPSCNEQPLTEIEAKVFNGQILIRVHCKNQQGLLPNLIAIVEKLNLDVINASVASFGMLTLDIIIVAEVERKFRLTVDEVAKQLRETLQATS